MTGLKKRLTPLTHHERRVLIEPESNLSLSTQTTLLGISRSSLYYQPIVNPEDIRIRNAIDQIFTDRPFFGSRRVKDALRDDYDISICRDQVRGHMQAMGLEAVYPKQNTSIAHPKHPVYPYLLRGISIQRPNQVWGTDITYIRLLKGFCYLVALLDWYSRYIVAWTLSETLEIDFCLDNLRKGLRTNVPEIHNSDQGSHFTSPQYTEILKAKEIQISMDGRGRCMDNIFTERLWRTIKYEHVYLRNHNTFKEAFPGIREYISWYNNKRRHSSLQHHTPAAIYFNKIIINQPVDIS